MQVSKYIIDFFKNKGIKNFYVFQGGVIMNLINEIGSDKSLKYVSPYHEQSLSMQVDTAARIDGYAVGLVTSGPGATNILTGVCSAYYDSIPCFFITGQVGQIHLKKNKSYRQYGFQETDVESIFKSVTKYCKQIKKPDEIKFELEKAYFLSKDKRPGPVLLDIPFNIQRAEINQNSIRKFIYPKKNSPTSEIKKVKFLNNNLFKFKKPLFLIGGGIKNQNQSSRFLSMIKKAKIPFATTWMSQDVVKYSNSLYLGSIGKNGHRSANFACTEADLIISLGQRFAVKNIFGKFANKAKIFSIDIDKQELNTPIRKINLKINLDIKSFFDFLNFTSLKNIKNKDWNNRTSFLKKNYFDFSILSKKSIANKKRINPFSFFKIISDIVSKNSILHVDIGAHQTWFFQSFLQTGQKIISHCGHGAMGHAVSASIASCYSKLKSKQNIVFIGDGGLMMNIQELNYISSKKLPIKIVVMNNKSLGNTFLGTMKAFNKTFANDEQTGFMAPNVKKLSLGFNIKYFKINEEKFIKNEFKKFKNFKGPAILNVEISKFQPVAELHEIKSKKKKLII